MRLFEHWPSVSKSKVKKITIFVVKAGNGGIIVCMRLPVDRGLKHSKYSQIGRVLDPIVS